MPQYTLDTGMGSTRRLIGYVPAAVAVPASAPVEGVTVWAQSGHRVPSMRNRTRWIMRGRASFMRPPIRGSVAEVHRRCKPVPSSTASDISLQAPFPVRSITYATPVLYLAPLGRRAGGACFCSKRPAGVGHSDCDSRCLRHAEDPAPSAATGSVPTREQDAGMCAVNRSAGFAAEEEAGEPATRSSL